MMCTVEKKNAVRRNDESVRCTTITKGICEVIQNDFWILEAQM